MCTARVVIGANFGDEGKGKMVDVYAMPDTTVVRFNGGAQAGHTVLRDGIRHVFHHFGSGTLKGAATFLSRYFINNPILYFQELETLANHGIKPQVMADPAGLVTVPYDMMINQMVEQMRDAGRHGSCGIGINETIQRSNGGFPLFVSDLARLPALYATLRTIRADWVPVRLNQLGVAVSEEWRARLASDAILDTFVEYCGAYRHLAAQFEWTGDVLFEGAQGLLLDQDHRFFPHVTHSHTGLHNVTALAQDAGLDALEVTYVTRVYATRHGAGPFPRENPALTYADETNVPNDWQGRLRFGHLDLDLLAESINHDRQTTPLALRHGLAVTCLDQVDRVIFWQNVQQSTDIPEFMQIANAAIDGEFTVMSFSPDAVIRESVMV